MSVQTESAAPDGVGRHEFTAPERARGRQNAAARRHRARRTAEERRKAWTATERLLYDALEEARASGSPGEVERARRAWSKHLAAMPPVRARQAAASRSSQATRLHRGGSES